MLTNETEDTLMARKSRSNGSTARLIQSVAVKVATMGKPEGDLITGTAAQVKAAIREIVPSQNRLAVRMEIRRLANARLRRPQGYLTLGAIWDLGAARYVQ
jgi:hypothetical protein